MLTNKPMNVNVLPTYALISMSNPSCSGIRDHALHGGHNIDSGCLSNIHQSEIGSYYGKNTNQESQSWFEQSGYFYWIKHFRLEINFRLIRSNEETLYIIQNIWGTVQNYYMKHGNVKYCK